MSLLRWGMGGDSDHVTGLNWDTGLVGHRKIPALQLARLPRYWREGAVEVRPFPAKTRLRASKAQGLSGEAVKGNPTTTVIPGVDESKSSPSNNRRLDRTDRSEGILPQTRQYLKIGKPRTVLCLRACQQYLAAFASHLTCVALI
jgi:hypothetical protein